MSGLRLAGLSGRNPLGFFAALGLLRLLSDAQPGVRLGWTTDEIVPVAVLHGWSDPDVLRSEVLTLLSALRSGPLFRDPAGGLLTDLKFVSRNDMRAWLCECRQGTALERELAVALVAEGAVDGRGNAKPTHVHFTAGQQQFLSSIGEGFDAVIADPTRLDEALHGPWRKDSTAKTIGWDAGSERVFALRGTNPSSEKKTGVPGADALAFVGLSAFPVAMWFGGLRTTSCDRGWKTSAMTWPIWSDGLSADAAASVVGRAWIRFEGRVVRPAMTRRELAALGVTEIVRAPIRRSDQGGYGSFGAAEVVQSAAVVQSATAVQSAAVVRSAAVTPGVAVQSTAVGRPSADGDSRADDGGAGGVL
jgi:hypothetical protein